jgi:membrane associated rhomboid family serine protease
MGRLESMFRRWKIVALLLVCCLTGSLFYLFLMGRLLDVVVRVVEVVGRLGRN